jgi:hypothetical protein
MYLVNNLNFIVLLMVDLLYCTLNWLYFPP